MFRPVGSLIGNLHLRTKSQDAILALQVIRIAEEQILKTFEDLPKEAVTEIKVKSYRDGQLTIVAPTLIAAELKMRSEGLKSAINQASGKEIVKAMRFRNI